MISNEERSGAGGTTGWLVDDLNFTPETIERVLTHPIEPPPDPNTETRIGTLSLLGVLLVLSGCATILGPAIGPIAAPISHAVIADTGSVWGNIAIAPFHLIWVPIGPVLGLLNGAILDYGFLQNGAYGAVVEVETDEQGNITRQRRALPFRALFNPVPYLRYDGWETVGAKEATKDSAPGK